MDLIEYDGLGWQVVSVDEDAMVVLRSLEDAQFRTVPGVDLLKGVTPALPQAKPTPLPDLGDASILEGLSPRDRQRTEFLHRAVHEVLTGRPPGALPAGFAPDPAYDLGTTTLEERVTAKSAQLGSLGTPISARTLKRHIASYRKHGIKGLVDGRALRRRAGTGVQSDEIIALLEEAMEGQHLTSTGTRSRVIKQVRWRAEDQGLDVPHDATLYRLLNRMERGRHTFGNATTRRTTANRPDRTFGGQRPQRPGELVEIDSTPLDVRLLLDDNTVSTVEYDKAGNVVASSMELTVAIDVATRIPLAAILRPSTKAADAAVMLARMLAPLPQQPGWLETVAYARSALPEGVIPSDAEVRRLMESRPTIVPEAITIDRGKAYDSSTFLTGCEMLGISVTLAAPRSPTDKPHIERFFRSLNTLFTQFLGGYKGSNVVLRGQDPDGEAVFNAAQVSVILDLWIAQEWMHRPHDGLRHPALAKRELTPGEMYSVLSGVSPAVPVPLARDQFIGLLPREFRAVNADGISLDQMRFDSPALHPYRRRPSGRGEPHADLWEIRYDPYRMNCIWLFDHEKNEYIEAEWTMANQAVMPFSRETVALARRILRERGDVASGQNILREANRIMTTPLTAAEKRSKRRAAPPLVPAPAEQPEPSSDGESEPAPTPLTMPKPTAAKPHRTGHFDEE
ncbi:Mu transposase C-terminal domain-containing protein [Serinicoccus sp. CNJ-927]|uniref:Mu transposase C-terminal domain-containing protein n=1 Tax=Serinicoccus sp. CNJ-927 TaxID=1904970 RepID=UPI00096A9C83|nr:Mu transposase C-terminal domain-containing protein [Serinicoccus sp. CNJ-927]